METNIQASQSTSALAAVSPTLGRTTLLPQATTRSVAVSHHQPYSVTSPAYVLAANALNLLLEFINTHPSLRDAAILLTLLDYIPGSIFLCASLGLSRLSSSSSSPNTSRGLSLDWGYGFLLGLLTFCAMASWGLRHDYAQYEGPRMTSQGMTPLVQAVIKTAAAFEALKRGFLVVMFVKMRLA